MLLGVSVNSLLSVAPGRAARGPPGWAAIRGRLRSARWPCQRPIADGNRLTTIQRRRGRDEPGRDCEEQALWHSTIIVPVCDGWRRSNDSPGTPGNPMRRNWPATSLQLAWNCPRSGRAAPLRGGTESLRIKGNSGRPPGRGPGAVSDRCGTGQWRWPADAVLASAAPAGAPPARLDVDPPGLLNVHPRYLREKSINFPAAEGYHPVAIGSVTGLIPASAVTAPPLRIFLSFRNPPAVSGVELPNVGWVRCRARGTGQPAAPSSAVQGRASKLAADARVTTSRAVGRSPLRPRAGAAKSCSRHGCRAEARRR
jgi:hypothetical protein